jgi:peptidoglycan hydrolase CwlO-like protein
MIQVSLGRRLKPGRQERVKSNGGTMENPTGEQPAAGKPKAPPLIPDGIKTALLFLVAIAVGFLLYDSYRFQQANRVEMDRIAEQIRILDKTGEARITTLKGQISETREAVGSTKAEIQKTTQQIQLEGKKTKAELSEALAAKAGIADVQAIRSEAESKIGQVSSEVGGVKSEVGTVKTDVGSVKTDLANTRRELEGTQRQLVDVKESLSAAVAKNASELDALRRKGERDYYEFTIPKRNQVMKVQDIQLILRKTDAKKGKFSVDIIVDDNKVEKKDRNINEPLAFLVGKSRLRYELVINWIQKESAGGYLSIPKER